MQVRDPDHRPPSLPVEVPPCTWRDVGGVIVQVALFVAGWHALLAVGFRLRWGSWPILAYRQPVAGLLLMALGGILGWLISPRLRWRWAVKRRRDNARVREFAAGRGAIPWRAAFYGVFLPALTIYMSNGRTLGSGDTIPMIATALSVVTDGDLTLDEFTDPAHPPYYVCQVGAHRYTRFSLGPVVIALPFVELARWGGADLGDPLMRQRLEKVVASLVAAAAAALMFLVLLRVADRVMAIVLTGFFALGTQNWSIASQALWQHGPVALCAAGVLLLECEQSRGGATRAKAMGEGLLLGLACACRPTAALLAVAVAVFIALRRPHSLVEVLAGTVLAYAPFFALHVGVYQSWLGPYSHAADEAKWGAPLAVSLPGNLISPARGLFVYQPLFVLALARVPSPAARRLGTGLTAALGLWCAAHLVMVSCYTHWWGGHAWGPRFLTELMPALLVLAAPAVNSLWRWRAGRGLILTLVLWSIGLQALGVYSPGAQRWMQRPVDIDVAPQRLWDWSDPPFFYPWRGRGAEPGMELDGVFLDMYGTVTTGDRHAVETVCAEIISHTGISLTARELSVTWGERFFAAMDSANEENFRTLYDVEAGTLVETMAQLGVALDPHRYVRRLSTYWQDPPLQPEAREFFAVFPLPICIVSNADRADLDAALARHALRVAHVVASEDVRSYKPAPAIFETALQQTGWRRERVLHVGDSLHSDVGGARRTGLRSGWVNRAHRIHDVGHHCPDYEFADLLGLSEFVRRSAKV